MESTNYDEMRRHCRVSTAYSMSPLRCTSCLSSPHVFMYILPSLFVHVSPSLSLRSTCPRVYRALSSFDFYFTIFRLVSLVYYVYYVIYILYLVSYILYLLLCIESFVLFTVCRYVSPISFVYASRSCCSHLLHVSSSFRLVLFSFFPIISSLYHGRCHH